MLQALGRGGRGPQIHGSLDGQVVSGYTKGVLCAFATALTTPGPEFLCLITGFALNWHTVFHGAIVRARLGAGAKRPGPKV